MKRKRQQYQSLNLKILHQLHEQRKKNQHKIFVFPTSNQTQNLEELKIQLS